MIRIVKLRGAPANHAVLVGASDYADLINFMEGVEASAEFATLRGAAEAQVVGTTYYRAVKIWNPQYDEDSQTGRTEFREKPRFDPIFYFSRSLNFLAFWRGWTTLKAAAAHFVQACYDKIQLAWKSR